MANFYGYTPQPFVFDAIINKSDFDINNSDSPNVALGRYILVQDKDTNGNIIGGTIYLKAYKDNKYIWKLISYLPMSNSTITNIDGGFKLINGNLGLQLSITTKGVKQENGSFVPDNDSTSSYDIDTNILIDSNDITLLPDGDDVQLQIDHATTADEATKATNDSNNNNIANQFSQLKSQDQTLEKQIEEKSKVNVSSYLESGTLIASIIVNGEEKKIYSPKTDLSNYYNKGEIDSKISNYYTKNEVDSKIQTLKVNYYTKGEINNKLNNYYTKNDLDTNFLTVDEARNNYVSKNEAYGSLTFIGFTGFNDTQDNSSNYLQIGIYDASNSLNRVVTADTTYSDMPYGKYTIKRINHSDSATYPAIVVDVGYKSNETIDVDTWASYNFESNSWRRINKICELGLASNYWNLGDKHSVLIDGDIYYLQIIGFHHDDLYNTASSTYKMNNSNKCNMTLQLGFNTMTIDTNTKNLYETSLVITGSSIVNFWSNSKKDIAGIKTCLSDISQKLINENNITLQQCVKKCYDIDSNGIQSYYEKISLPAEEEVLGNHIYRYSQHGEGKQYDFFASNQNTYIKYFADTSLQSNYKISGFRQLFRSPGYKDGQWQVTSTYYSGYGPNGSPSCFVTNKSIAICPIVYI